MKINLHTHTARCGHASGEVADYCRAALAQGVTTLGMSDHSPFRDGRYGHARMDFGELPEYLADIEAARREFPGLELFAGLELDYSPRLGRAFYEDVYLGEYGLDYLIGGTHFSFRGEPAVYVGGRGVTSDGGDVRENVERSIELMHTGLICYLAHPDIIAASYHGPFTPEIAAMYRDLAETAKALSIPLEINAYGLRKTRVPGSEGMRPPYPWRPFWELVAELGGVSVVTGSDAHRPEDVWGNMPDAEAFAARYGFELVNDRVAAVIRAKR